ncbi:TPA: hypothetical protein ACL6QT_002011, partial [Streptococcus pneumoniae]
FVFEKDISKKNVRFFIYFQKNQKTELKEFLENFCFFFTVKKNSAIMSYVIKYDNKRRTI